MALIAPVGRCVFCSSHFPDAARACAEFSSDAVFTDSGTSALALAIEDAARRIATPTGGEVVIPAYCCPDILSAVRAAGCKPVLADLEQGTPWLEPGSVKSKINRATVAVIAVNFLGIAERLEEIRAAMSGTRALLIDDSCQALPAAEDVVAADYRVYSFGRGKPVSMLHGGAVYGLGEPSRVRATLEARRGGIGLPPAVKCRLFNLARHRYVYGWLEAAGIAGQTRYRPPRAPGPMTTEIAAVIAAAIEAAPRGRNPAADAIEAALDTADPQDITQFDAIRGKDGPSLLRYPVLAASRPHRDRLLASVRRAGVCASPLYNRPLPGIPGTELAEKNADYPGALYLADRLITLPVHDEISDTIAARIAASLADTDSRK